MDFSLFTEYGQFYIADSNPNGDTGHPDFWNPEAFDDRLAVSVDLLGVSVENDEAIANGKLHLFNPRIEARNLLEYDHVVEASLLVKSGILQVLDCPTFHPEIAIEVTPAWYRVRVYSSHLSSAWKESPEDTYLIYIWQDEFSERKVLKRWHRK